MENYFVSILPASNSWVLEGQEKNWSSFFFSHASVNFGTMERNAKSVTPSVMHYLVFS